MSWILLFAAGLLEVVWAAGLKHNAGFTRLGPSLITLAAMVASLYLLSLALRTLPLGAAYATWVGIGAVGAVAVGIVVFGESLSAGKLISVTLIVLGIVGLKMSAGAGPGA